MATGHMPAAITVNTFTSFKTAVMSHMSLNVLGVGKISEAKHITFLLIAQATED
jgi:hypothetical protein